MSNEGWENSVIWAILHNQYGKLEYINLDNKFTAMFFKSLSIWYSENLI